MTLEAKFTLMRKKKMFFLQVAKLLLKVTLGFVGGWRRGRGLRALEMCLE